MKTYTKKDITKAGKSISVILSRIEYLVNCPENNDGELVADCAALAALQDQAETLVTYLNSISYKN